MSETPWTDAELAELALRALDGDLDAASHARLESILVADGSARERYAELMVTVSALDWRAGAETHAARAADRAVGSVILEGVIDRQREASARLEQVDEQRLRELSREQWQGWRPPYREGGSVARVVVIPKAVVWLGLAAVLGLAATVVLVMTQKPASAPQHPVVAEEHRRASPSDPDPVASLVDHYGVAWVGGEPDREGLFYDGRYTLTAGWAEVRTVHGVSIVLEAPVSFEVLPDNRVVLSAGNLVADVPEAAHGFAVQTPTGWVVDYGTTFGVSVDRVGATVAHVFSGEIEVASGTARTEAGLLLRADESAGVGRGGAVERREAEPGRFAREVPGTAYQAAVLRSRPMCYWRGPIDEATRQLTDHGWLGADAQTTPTLLHGRAGFVDDDPSGALDFGRSGTASARVEPHERFDLAQSFTIEAWCWIEPGHEGFMRIVSTRFEGGGFGLGINGTALNHSLDDLPTNVPVLTFFETADFVGEVVLPEGRWVHLVAVVDDAGRVAMYVDGAPIAVEERVHLTQASAPPGDTPLMIGRNPYTGRGIQAWHGRLDEVAIYDRALSGDEVRHHFHATQSP